MFKPVSIKILAVLFCFIPFWGQAQDIYQVTSNLPPFTISPPSVDNGFVWSILQEAHRRAGIPFAPKFVPWGRAQAIAIDSNDTVIFGLSRTPAREDSYQWIADLSEVQVAMIRLEGKSPINTLGEAAELGHIGVNNRTPFSQFLQESGLKNLHVVSDEYSNVSMLMSGRIDAWYTPIVRAYYMLRKAGYRGRIVVGNPFQNEHLWLAAGKEFPSEISRRLAIAVQEVKQDQRFNPVNLSSDYIR